MRYSKIIFITSLLTGIVIFFIRCSEGNASNSNDPRGNAYAGSAACVSCHKDVMETYAHSNHYKTSAKVDPADLKKFITAGNSTAHYADSDIVRLEEKHSAFFQTYTKNGVEARSEKLDVSFGSAEKAQTYAYWKNEQLFELPLTFFTGLQTWTNSPGYPMRSPFYDRVILSRCFECHGSFVAKTDFQSGPLQVSEKLEANSIIYGIDCERCHGPSAEHVAFQQKNPGVKQAKFVTSIKSLNRQQQLDLCASCHSGNDMDVQRTLFAFQPGDSLSNFYLPNYGAGPAEPDVHARQTQLLKLSKCFQQSTLTCITCHNSHESEDNKLDVFVAKCMSCHQNSQHAMQLQADSKKCIDCHMPLQVSKSLDFNNGVQTKSIPYLLRTHKIAIYPSN